MVTIAYEKGGAPVRIGVIGAGIMAGGTVDVLAAHPAAEVVAITSRRPGPAHDLAASLAGTTGRRPVVHPDLASLLADDTVDAVVLSVPDHLHGTMMVAAAEAGKHVLVEKPFTTSLAEADAAVAALRRAGVTAMCLFNHRWVPAYAQAKDLMPQVGRPVSANARKNDTIHVPTEMLSWADRTTCAWFLSSHDIDLVSWLLDDRVVRVTALARHGLLRARGIDTPDAVQILAEYSSGAIATFESCWVQPNSFPTMVDSYLQVVGEAGTVQLDRQQENIALTTAAGYTFPRNTLQRTVHGIPGGAYRDAIGHFVDCVRLGREPLVSIESSREVTAVLAAAHRSIAERRTVDVPPVGATDGPGWA